MVYCLAPVIGSGTEPDPFRVQGARAIIDLRGDATVAEGWALASVDTLPDGAIELGSGLTDKPNRPTTRDVEDALGLDPRDTLAGLTVRQIIEDVLIVHGDDASTPWKPLRSSQDDHYRIWLDGLVSETAIQAGGSTITDDFVRADSASLGSSSEGWSWTENVAASGDGDGWYIESNLAVRRQEGSDDATARAESDLDGDDQYTELSVATLTGATQRDNTNQAAAAVRFSPSAFTQYAGILSLEDPSTGDARDRISKIVDGTRTDLVDQTITISVPWSGTIRVEAEGSTVRFFRDGTERASVTDTSITGHLRTGLGRTYANPNNPANSTEIDTFEAGDLGAGGTVTLSGDLPSASGASGALGRSLALIGSSDAASDAAGPLAVTRALSGSSDSASASDALLGVTLTLAGTSSAASDMSGVLTISGVVSLSGDLNQASSAGAAMARKLGLQGVSASASDAAALARRLRTLTGTSSAASDVSSATMERVRSLSGDAPGASGLDAVLSRTLGLAGDAPAASGASALLRRLATLQGVIASASDSDAVLTVIRVEVRDPVSAHGSVVIPSSVRIATERETVRVHV